VAGQPDAPTGLEGLLAKGGLALGSGVVADPLVREVTGDDTSPLVARWGTHEAVRGLRAPASFLGTAPLEVKEHDPRDATVHLLAWSSAESWVEPGGIVERDEDDRAGPLPLLALADLHPGGTDAGVIVLVGDADWLANDGVRRQANGDLAVRLLGALTGRDDLITLPPRPPTEGALTVEWADHIVLSMLALLGLPGGCLALAGVLAVRRAGR